MQTLAKTVLCTLFIGSVSTLQAAERRNLSVVGYGQYTYSHYASACGTAKGSANMDAQYKLKTQCTGLKGTLFDVKLTGNSCTTETESYNTRFKTYVVKAYASFNAVCIIP